MPYEVAVFTGRIFHVAKGWHPIKKIHGQVSGKIVNRNLNTSYMEWTVENNRLKKTFKFKDFTHAFGFMTRVAIIAEKVNHHPTWTNTYNTVSFELSTHDAGNIVTDKDRALAKAIDQLEK